MPVRPDEPAPYAPSTAVLDIVDRYRNKGLSTPINSEVLARVGVSDSLIPRTLKSLQQLDLVDEDGRPTPQLEGLRRASTEEFKPRLAEVIRGAYADVFQFADPATDDEWRITDAFRVYTPVSMRPRMVSLFLGLCEAADLIPPRERRPSPTPSTRAPSKARSKSPRPSSSERHTIRSAGRPQPVAGGIPQPLAGLLAEIPSTEDGWTLDRRNRFVETFGAVLDFCIPIRDENRGNTEPE